MENVDQNDVQEKHGGLGVEPPEKNWGLGAEPPEK